MPFDPNGWQPNVTVLPPTPPERGPIFTHVGKDGGGRGPQRVHIEITITDRRTVSRPPHKRSLSTFWLIVLLLIALAAHAQPITYVHWQEIGSGGMARLGHRARPPTGWRGEQKHCHRYYVGDQPYTTCR
jgi:hypothetical protein